MAKLEYDIADKLKLTRFPAHGWAENSQGVKLLWFPLVRLLEKRLRAEVSNGRLPPGTHNSVLPFWEMLRNLVINLRELSQLIRESCDQPMGDEFRIEDHRAYEMVPLLTDLAFSYLRRLPDLLAIPCRPLLFGQTDSVPKEFKKWVASTDSLENQKPICDWSIFRDTIQRHGEWFDKLRGSSATTNKKGIRDALEHRRVRLLVGKQQTGTDRPRIKVMLDSRDADVEIRKDITPCNS